MRTLWPDSSDAARGAEGQFHPILGHFHVQAIVSAQGVDLFSEGTFGSRHDLCAAVCDDCPGHARLFAPSELQVDWRVTDQVVSSFANE